MLRPIIEAPAVNIGIGWVPAVMYREKTDPYSCDCPSHIFTQGVKSAEKSRADVED